MENKLIARVEFKKSEKPNYSITATFTRFDGLQQTKNYKTRRGAKVAQTRFFNYSSKLYYNNVVKKEIITRKEGKTTC